MLTLGWSQTPQGRQALRRGASRMIRAALRIRSRPFPINAGSPVLVVSPHPDDETYGCGGAVALLVRERISVHVAFVTDGAASHPGHPAVAPADLAARRAAEARLAAQALGVDPNNLTFLGGHDGTLACLGPDQAGSLVGAISRLAAQVRPAAVLLPSRRDGSSEHDAVFSLVGRGLEQAGLRPRILEYPVWSWWNPLLLLSPLVTCRRVWRIDIADVLAVKARAISAYVSQALPIPPDAAAVLPPGFNSMFLCGEEFLFEG